MFSITLLSLYATVESVTRKRTTVYLDEDIMGLAISKGINVSQVCREALIAAVGRTSRENIQMRIDKLKDQMDILEKVRAEDRHRQSLLGDFTESWMIRVEKMPVDEEHERYHLKWIEARKREQGLGHMDDRDLLAELEKRRKEIIGTTVEIGR